MKHLGSSSSILRWSLLRRSISRRLRRHSLSSHPVNSEQYGQPATLFSQSCHLRTVPLQWARECRERAGRRNLLMGGRAGRAVEEAAKFSARMALKPMER